MAKPFCENRRGARCFAELFGTLGRETIHAVGGEIKIKKIKKIKKINKMSVRVSMHSRKN
jgi:hypothetical protein